MPPVKMDVTPEEIGAACRLVRPGVSASSSRPMPQSDDVLAAVRWLWRLDSRPSDACGCPCGWGRLRNIAGRLHAMKDVYDKPTRRRLIWLRAAFAAAAAAAGSELEECEGDCVPGEPPGTPKTTLESA